MASPDFSEYVDLTVYDVQPSTVYDNAVAYAQVAVPEWTPIAGSIEDAVIQAGAYLASYLGGAINRVPDGVLEGLLKLFGIERNVGEAPTGYVQITTIDNSGYTIPAGTRVGYLDTTNPDNTVLYTFDTTEDLSISAGSTTGTVGISGTALVQYPALTTGTTLQLFSSVSYINTVTLFGNLSIGADPETDKEYIARSVAKLNSYTTALVTATQIQQYILASYPNAYRAKVYNRLNSTNDNASVTATNGYATIYVAKSGGASLTATEMTAIQTDVANRTVAGLTIGIKPPNIVPITATTTVTMKAGYSNGTVSSNVSTALSLYLHPDYWNWDGTIYQNELISLIDQVEGVDRVVSLSIAAPSGGATVSGSNLVFDKYGSLPSVTSTVSIQVS